MVLCTHLLQHTKQPKLRTQRQGLQNRVCVNAAHAATGRVDFVDGLAVVHRDGVVGEINDVGARHEVAAGLQVREVGLRGAVGRGHGEADHETAGGLQQACVLVKYVKGVMSVQ